MRREKLFWRGVTYIMLAIMLVVALFPVYWIFITSLKTNAEIYSLIPSMLPKNPTIDGYKALIEKTDFLLWLRNSAVVSVVVATVSVSVSAVAAYGMARFHFRGSKLIGSTILVSYLLPPAMLFIPIYIVITRLGIAGSILGLILIYPTITTPYATWVLTTYFRGLPPDFEEAAMIDGCSRLQALRYVILPLASPGVIATLVFAFTLCWSEYLYALVISDSSSTTVPVGLSGLIIGDIFRWNEIMAGAVITSVPVILLYTVASNYIVTGLTLGGTKG
jgi:multiple sugar transport system permease protein